jgi:hypothetical protein
MTHPYTDQTPDQVPFSKVADTIIEEIASDNPNGTVLRVYARQYSDMRYGCVIGQEGLPANATLIFDTVGD